MHTYRDFWIILLAGIVLIGCRSNLPADSATTPAAAPATGAPTAINDTLAVPAISQSPVDSRTGTATFIPTARQHERTPIRPWTVTYTPTVIRQARTPIRPWTVTFTPGPPTDTPTAAPPTPTPLPAARIEVEGVFLPPGFSLIRFADFERPTSLTFDAQGRLLAASLDGSVHMLADQDGDGRADRQTVFASGFRSPLGVEANLTGEVYVSSREGITVLRDTNGDEVADTSDVWVGDLPTGLHQNNSIKIGPDGWLYAGMGSTCDACEESSPLNGTILRFNLQTAQREIVATGLRNPYDLAFHPESGALFATDNGRDDLGLFAPFEEINHIVPGGFYGWPGCWDELQGPECEGSTPAIAFFDPHSSVNSLEFYDGTQFPAGYQDNLFAAVWGSDNVDVMRGIWRVILTRSGDTYMAQKEWFLQWPGGWLLGLTVGPDGALYTGNFFEGGIYRISYGAP